MMYQDNIPTMLLETNDWGSNGNITKNVEAIYYIVKDSVDRGDLKIEWCPTEEMWEDVLTKPKQVK